MSCDRHMFHLNSGSPPPAPASKDLMHLQVREWYRLGLALDLDEYDLDIIKKDYQGDARAQALTMFQLWLTRQPQASYEQLVKALHKVGDERMVSVLCKKYGKHYCDHDNNLIYCNTALYQ